MKDKCRWCGGYQPDARYNGCVGWCKTKDKPTAYDQTCTDMKQGKQYWLDGREVKE